MDKRRLSYKKKPQKCIERNYDNEKKEMFKSKLPNSIWQITAKGRKAWEATHETKKIKVPVL